MQKNLRSVLSITLGFFLIAPLIAGAASITIGETSIFSGTDSGNGGLILVQDASLSQTATIQSISFYVKTAAGNLRLGIYDATGTSGGPGSLKAQTNSFVPVAGWNTQNVISPVSLPAGNYWLAYFPSSSSLTFAANFSTGSFKYAPFTFGSMPNTFPAVAGQGTTHWSLYATLNTSSGPDTTPPTVSIANPANGAFASSTMTVSANASDNVGVAGVQFLLDGVNLGAEDTTAPYSVSWNTTGVSAGTHTLLARARDAAGNAATSSAISVTVDNQAPTGTVVINGGASATKSTSATLTLSASDANGVTQMRFSNTGTSFNAAVAYAPTATWTLTTGAGTKTVYAQFKDAAGNWSASATSAIVLDTTAPTISARSVSSITTNAATINWTTNEPATSQTNYGLTVSYGATTTLDTTLVTAHAHVISGLTPGTLYHYRIRTMDAAGNEAVSSDGTFTTSSTPDTTPPSQPQNVAATPVSQTQINLVWSPSSDNIAVAGYQIFQNGAQIATTTTATFSNTGLLPSTSYIYAVSAFDAAGNVSPQSAATTATTFTPDTTSPSTPTNLSATAISSSQINLTWVASTDNTAVTGYQIFRNGTQVGTSATSSYSDAGLTASTTYSYTVAAYDAAGNVSPQSNLANATTAPVSSGTPTLIQHVASSANPVGLGISGNNFKIPLPNNVGAGNVLILGMTYPHGASPTVTDSNGNTWPASATVSADAGAGGNVSSIFVLPNANAGQTVITVSFASPIIPFNYAVSEFNNVASASPVNGTSATASKAGTTVTTGSFTPGNNDANGGNLIWNYYAIAGGASGNPTKWVPGAGFTLLDADIAWNTNQGFPHASQYFVQSTAAAINPSITSTGDSNGFNAVAVALKAAGAGTPAPVGIHINKIIHQTSNIPPTSTWTLQEPATGNLRVLATANGNNLTNVTSVTDSDGGTWTKVEPAGDEPQIWYSANTSADPNLTVTLHMSPGPTMTVLFYDISGAAANPFDVAVGAPSMDVSGKTSVNNMPNITPTTQNGLVLAVMGDGNGPGLGLAAGSPSGAVFDLVNYAGEIDLDLMENADGQAHLYNLTTTPEAWNWLITANANNSVFGTAVAFKAAP